MQALDILAKVHLQSNIKSFVSDIESQLRGVKSNINFGITNASNQKLKVSAELLKVIAHNLAAIQPIAQNVAASFKQVGDAFKNVVKSAESATAAVASNGGATSKSRREAENFTSVLAQFGDQAGLAAKRYSAFTIAVGIGFSVIRGVTSALQEAVQFQDKLVKISQVSGRSIQALKPLTKEIGNLSTQLGVSSSKLTDISLTLIQAGLSSKETKQALEALAKTALAPTFESLDETVEGVIATLQQFGTGTENLERQLGAINRVSAEFAVESGDIVRAIQISGSAFAELGKNVKDAAGNFKDPIDAFNEFIAVFTSIRATTRESAETISTGLKTISARLQRRSTLEFFKSIGAELTNTEGQFIGFFEAIQKISKAIEDIPTTDPRFAALVEELGGIRQINKTIPLLRQVTLAQRAYNTAIRGQDSLNEDVAKSMDSLLVRLSKVQEGFLKLFRETIDTTTFRVIAEAFFLGANAALALANAIKPLIPLLTALAAIKIGQGIGEFFPAFQKRVLGGTDIKQNFNLSKAIFRNRGGSVPGVGNTDTVDAKLTPGEFVIRKEAAQKIGYGTLRQLNKAGYNKGGLVERILPHFNKGGIVGYPLGFVHGGEVPERTVLGPIGKRVSNQNAILNVFLNRMEEISKFLPEFGKNLGLSVAELKQRRGQFNRNLATGSEEVTIDPKKGTTGTIQHELAHSLDSFIGRVLGSSKLGSQIEGSPVRDIMKGPQFALFREKLVSEARESGLKKSQLANITTAPELFARFIATRSKEERETIFKQISESLQSRETKIDFPPEVAISLKDISQNLAQFSTNLPVGQATTTIPMAQDLIREGYPLSTTPARRTIPLSANDPNGPPDPPEGYDLERRRRSVRPELGFFSGFKGPTGNLQSGRLRFQQEFQKRYIQPFQNAFTSINKAIETGQSKGFAATRLGKVATNATRVLGSDQFQLAALAGSVASTAVFGTVAGNKKQDRTKGAFGEVVSGTLGGAATGAFAGSAGGPVGQAAFAAAGALVGFTVSLQKAEEELKQFKLEDALETAVSGLKKGTSNFKEVLDTVDEIGKGGVAQQLGDVFTSLLGSVSPVSIAFDKLKGDTVSFGNLLEDFKTIRNRAVGGRREEALKDVGRQIVPDFLKNVTTQASKFGSVKEFEASDIGKELRRQFVGEAGLNKEGFGVAALGSESAREAFRSAAGEKIREKALVRLTDTVDSNISAFEKLLNAIKAAEAATAGFGQAISLAEANASGRVGQLQFAEKGDVLRNPTNETFGAFESVLKDTLGELGRGGDFTQANLAGFTLANIPDIARQLQAGIGGELGTPEALDKVFDNVTQKFFGKVVNPNLGGSDAEIAVKKVSDALQAGLSGKDITGLSQEEISNLLSSRVKDFASVLGSLRDALDNSKNALVGTFARTAEILNDIAENKFQAAATDIEAFNKKLEFNNQKGFANVDAPFIAQQRELAGRGGVAEAFNPKVIADQLLLIEQEKQRVAVQGGTPEQVIGLNERATALIGALNNLRGASNKLNSSIENQIKVLDEQRNERLGFAEKAFLGGPKEKADLAKGLALVTAFSQGQLNPNQLNKEDRQLFVQTGRELENTVPGGFNNLFSKYLEQQSGFANLPPQLKAQRERLQNQVVGNLNVSAEAARQNTRLQEAGVNAARATAVQKFELTNATALSEFNTKFETAVKSFGDKLSSIPSEISLKGNIKLDVAITGAEAFARAKESFGDLIETKVNEGINNLTKKLRAKPPTGPGLPI